MSSSVRLSTVVLDTHDAHELAAFYQRLLGYVVRAEESHWVLIGPPPGTGGTSSPSRPKPSTCRPCGPPASRATSR